MTLQNGKLRRGACLLALPHKGNRWHRSNALFFLANILLTNPELWGRNYYPTPKPTPDLDDCCSSICQPLLPPQCLSMAGLMMPWRPSVRIATLERLVLSCRHLERHTPRLPDHSCIWPQHLNLTSRGSQAMRSRPRPRRGDANTCKRLASRRRRRVKGHADD